MNAPRPAQAPAVLECPNCKGAGWWFRGECFACGSKKKPVERKPVKKKAKSGGS